MIIKNRFTGDTILKVETLAGANLRCTNLRGADLRGADITGADITGADLTGADLAGADLTRADLAGADLTRANLRCADITGADITGADLAGANLAGADITGATMPDGRKWEIYCLDHLAGICDAPEVKAKAVAAWGAHSWRDCPLHCALGIDSCAKAPKPLLAAAWVALYDARLLTVEGA